MGESTLFEPYNDGRKTCRVLLYENNELIRAGIRTTLDACSDISVVAEAVPGSDIDALLKRSEPNVVVSEYCRKVFNPGGRLDRPKSAFANLPVVILCSTDGPELDDAVRVGARGLVLRSDAAEQLASAVREVAIGNAFLARDAIALNSNNTDSPEPPRHPVGRIAQQRPRRSPNHVFNKVRSRPGAEPTQKETSVQKQGGNLDDRGLDPTACDRESRNILVYTDDRLAGAGMASTLKQIPDVSIDVIANEMDLVLAMESGKADLVVVYFDCLLGDRAVVQDKMRRAYPAHATPVLAVLSNELEHVLQALELGARGLVMKTDEPNVLMNTARALLNGECYLAPAISTHIVQMLNKVGECQDKKVDRAIFEVLTKREKEVARMLALGLNTRQIATRTYITRATVKTHISNIMGKLNVDERSQIVALVYRSGWINEAMPAAPPPGEEAGSLRG